MSHRAHSATYTTQTCLIEIAPKRFAIPHDFSRNTARVPARARVFVPITRVTRRNAFGASIGGEKRALARVTRRRLSRLATML
jgi:hypothetical protein